MSQFSQSNQAIGQVQGQIQTQIQTQDQSAAAVPGQMQQAGHTATSGATAPGAARVSLKDWASI